MKNIPKRLKRKTIYKSDWINLYVDKVQIPSGKTIEQYHQLDYQHESVIVLLINNNKEICFMKSPRYTTQRVEWELPGGIIEPNEDTLVAAKREALEETGFKAKTLKQIYRFNPDNCISNQVVHIALATTDHNKQQEFDTNETQSIHWLSPTKAKGLIIKHEINDGCTLTALLLYFNETLLENSTE